MKVKNILNKTQKNIFKFSFNIYSKKLFTNIHNHNNNNNNVNDNIEIKSPFSKHNDNSDYFKPEELILFKDKKFLLVEGKNANFQAMNILKYSCIPFAVYSLYALGYNIFFFKIIKSVLWFLSYKFFKALFEGVSFNLKHLIYKVYLLEDGQTLQLILAKGELITNIKGIRKMNESETKFYFKKMMNIHDQFYPLIINEQLYLIPHNAIIYNKDILSAISNGKYIQLQESQKVKKENTIDI